MTSVDQRYMDATHQLSAAIDEFVVASYAVGFDEDSIANTILDRLYDVNPNLYKAVQCHCLPMVKEFELSKSVKYDELKVDWETALTKWEKLQMWKILNK